MSRLAPRPKVAARYNRTGRTLSRWDDNPPPHWPHSVVINGRRYYDEDALDEFDRLTLAQAIAPRGQKTDASSIVEEAR